MIQAKTLIKTLATVSMSVGFLTACGAPSYQTVRDTVKSSADGSTYSPADNIPDYYNNSNGGSSNGSSSSGDSSSNGASNTGEFQNTNDAIGNGAAVTNPDDVPNVPVRNNCNLISLQATLVGQGAGNYKSKDVVNFTYCAFFARLPDASGRGFWRILTAAPASQAMTLDSLYVTLYNSPEFQNAIGSSSHSNASYVTWMYQKVLNRAADSSGYNFYLNALNNGSLSRQDVLLQIIHSTEFQSALAANVVSLNIVGSQVPFIYKRVLGRSDATNLNDEGLGFYEGLLALPSVGTITNANMALRFVDSAEFDGMFLGGQKKTALGFTRLAYRYFLNREPEAAGQQFWINYLESHAQASGTTSDGRKLFTVQDFLNVLAPNFIASTEFTDKYPWMKNIRSVYDF